MSKKPKPTALVEAPRDRHTLWCTLLLLAAGTLAYCNSFGGAFLLDDIPDIVENASVHQFWPPTQVLAAEQNRSRPVAKLSFAANYALGGKNPWGYHLVNLTLHLIAGLALFGILRRTLRTPRLQARFGAHATPVALAAAALWLVHPLNTQAVTYVVQRYESMMGMFLLLTLYCFIRGHDARRGNAWYALAGVSCALGMCCKQVMVGFNAL